MLFITVIPIQFKLIKKPFYNLILIIFVCVCGTILPMSLYKEEKAAKIGSELWKNYIDVENINNYIEKGKTVFVSISASWCMICNINEITVMSSYEIVNFLSQPNIETVKVDITKNSKHAEYFFKNQENFGVPTYIIYNKKCPNGYRFSGKISEKKFFEEFNHCL
ncbi:MAG: thioredoxin family protein [Rickettsiales bacterium]|nr:thioredoxin family protein [Rickettsiales bacterium]